MAGSTRRSSARQKKIAMSSALDASNLAGSKTRQAEVVNEGVGNQSGERPSASSELPPRGAKAKALVNKVWTLDAPATRNRGQKRALPDEAADQRRNQGGEAVVTQPKGVSSNAEVRFLHGAKRSQSRGAVASADGDITLGNSERSSKRQKKQSGHQLPDDLDSEDVEEVPKRVHLSGSDGDQSASSEDDVGANDNWAELTAEKAAWSDEDDAKTQVGSGVKGKGRQTYITLDDLQESSISGSDFQPDGSEDHESSAESSEVEVFDPDTGVEAFDPDSDPYQMMGPDEDAWMTDEEYTHEQIVANLAKDEERRKADAVQRRKAEKEKERIRHEKAKKEAEEPLWLDVPPKKSSSSQAGNPSNKRRAAAASTSGKPSLANLL
ncbi:uncharacterized protein BXZ73DRAFT_82275 [Epithele typhae]|uniref:uncharacterized protein n=1 Tax=Epithele typhae TaxID=378194 RepID=UPI00200742E0|nr:uncharacterized protein BXZ73DRAFT_82275 [Epithele typhae]KAH9912536.1 hypothetical protein BXZ73DRAFT_82275 [Epithele typhae]